MVVISRIVSDVNCTLCQQMVVFRNFSFSNHHEKWPSSKTTIINSNPSYLNCTLWVAKECWVAKLFWEMRIFLVTVQHLMVLFFIVTFKHSSATSTKSSNYKKKIEIWVDFGVRQSSSSRKSFIHSLWPWKHCSIKLFFELRKTSWRFIVWTCVYNHSSQVYCTIHWNWPTQLSLLLR